MKKKTKLTGTLKNSMIYLSSTLLEKAIGFIMLPIYASQLGATGYGILGMIDVTIAVLNIMSKYGVAGAINRFYFARKTVQERNVLISTSIFVMLSLTIFTCTPPMVFNNIVGRIAFGSNNMGLYVIIGVLAFMIDANGFVGQQYLLIRQKAIAISLLSVLRLIIAVGLNIYLIVILKLGVLGVLYSHLITAIVFFLIFQGYALLRTGIHFKKEDAKDLLYFFLPLIPGYAATFIRNNADKIIIRTYLGLSYIGVYSIVMKFSMLIGLLVFKPFMKTWIPKRMEICENEDGAKLISKVFTMHTTIMLFIGILLSVEIPLFIKILTPKEFWIPPMIALFAVFSRIMFNSYYHLNFGLVYGKKTHKISIILILITIVGVPVYIIFIRAFGILGAFMSACLINSLQALFGYYLARPHYNITYDFKKLFVMFLSAILLTLLINQISIENINLAKELEVKIAPIIKEFLRLTNLDTFKDGRLLIIFTEKLLFVIEGVIKAMCAMAYIIVMIVFGIISKEHMLKIADKIIQFFTLKRYRKVSP